MSRWIFSTALAMSLAACQQANNADVAMQPNVSAIPASTSESQPVASQAIATPGATPTYRAFKDYVVGCDNTLHCTAVAARTDDQIGFAVVLQRDAGPTGIASLKITNMSGDPLNAGALVLDGKPSPLSALPWTGGNEGTLQLTDIAAIKRFVDIAMNGRYIRLGPDNELSLQGFKAALLYIDEVQGRLDGATALARPGPMDASHVPSAPPAPVLARPYSPAPAPLDDATAEALAKLVRKGARGALEAAGCDVDDSADSIRKSDEVFALTGLDALVFVTCNSGAYQSEVIAYRVPTNGSAHATRLVLPPTPFTVEDGRAVTFETLVGADYDPGTATLSEFSKGRGIADCGTATTWRFDGSQFQLASFSSLDRCSGVGSENWPTYWRTQE